MNHQAPDPAPRPRGLATLGWIAGAFGVGGIFIVIPSTLAFIGEVLAGREDAVSPLIFAGLVLALLLFVAAPLLFALAVRARDPRAPSFGIIWWAVMIFIIIAGILPVAGLADPQIVPLLFVPVILVGSALGIIAYLWRLRKAELPGVDASSPTKPSRRT